MSESFGHIAHDYDQDFTYSLIGKLQRNEVYHLLDTVLNISPRLNILELNCGTGEDALYMASKGHKVLATDISKDMIKEAIHKAKDIKNITFKQLDIKDLSGIKLNCKYNLVFSNFGGLNCLAPSELQALNNDLIKVLEKDAVFIAVVMGRKCLWERLYFTLKDDLENAGRRKRKGAVVANLEGIGVPTFYYSPKEFKNLFPDFTSKRIKPIGLFVPPSYLSGLFRRAAMVLKLLSWPSKSGFMPSRLSDYADHYFIQLQLKRE